MERKKMAAKVRKGTVLAIGAALLVAAGAFAAWTYIEKQGSATITADTAAVGVSFESPSACAVVTDSPPSGVTCSISQYSQSSFALTINQLSPADVVKLTGTLGLPGDNTADLFVWLPTIPPTWTGKVAPAWTDGVGKNTVLLPGIDKPFGMTFTGGASLVPDEVIPSASMTLRFDQVAQP